jgi:hypothetical protein
MSRVRNALGLLAGTILVASSAAHSLLGWPQLRERLAVTQAPPDLVTGLRIGWQFAGVAMLVFGGLVLALFADRLRGRPVSLRPALAIALVYVAFGLWAYLVSGRDPFFLVFIVPGLMLAVASWAPPSRTARTNA